MRADGRAERDGSPPKVEVGQLQAEDSYENEANPQKDLVPFRAA